MSSDLITTTDAAALLGVSPSTIYRMEQQGLITSYRTPGGQRRFSQSALEQYLAESGGIVAPQNPSQYKEESVTPEIAQLELFPMPRVPRISQQSHTKIWSHRHVAEDADVDDLFARIENDVSGETDQKNTLNDLPGKEWLRFQSSWFLFNALPSDLREEREVTSLTDHHPATYSPTMVGDFILFFTKPGEMVLDPFVGIGSTLVACDRTGRKGIGIELSPKYAEIARLRTAQTVINCDCRDIDTLNLPQIDFCITSPPYWNVLQRSTKDFRKDRTEDGYDSQYSSDDADIGNVEEYEAFLQAIYDVFAQIHEILKPKGYVVIVTKNVKKGPRMYPLAWDLARKLGDLYVLKDEKIWVQDKVKLAPYGYPHAWVSNIHHHYCLVFRKE